MDTNCTETKHIANMLHNKSHFKKMKCRDCGRVISYVIKKSKALKDSNKNTIGRISLLVVSHGIKPKKEVV